MKFFRRALLATLVALSGLAVFQAAPSQAYCVEDPINEGRCLPLCPRVGPFRDCVE